MITRCSSLILVFVVLALASPSAADELVENQTVLSFGSDWTYRQGPVQPTDVWPPLSDSVTGEDEGWVTGPGPFLSRSAQTDEQIQAERRRRSRRARRRARPFEGTILLYDRDEYPGSVGDNFEPGPNSILFVTTFEVTNVDEVRSLLFELKFAGGFVAYLNGREWVRHNLPTSTPADAHADIIWQADWVSQTVANHWQRAYTGLDPSFLVEGVNTLAIDLRRRPHGGSRPFYLDAQVKVFRENGFVKSPYLQHVTQDGVTVMWETATPGVGYVEYGSGDRLSRVATAPRVAATMNEIRLEDLEPDTTYYYRVHTHPADGSEEVVSEIHHFRTTVPPGTPFSFILYGDNRTNTRVHSRLVQRMLSDADRQDVRFIVNTGDLVTHSAPWDEWQNEFFGPAGPMLSEYPLYPVLGNHEGNHETWYEYMSLPNNESWYTFSYGDADFFALNTSTSMLEGSAQNRWLREALAASTARWQIAMFHHPPYSCVPVRKPGNLLVQENFVPIFEDLGVDLVLMGHDHLYGRSFPINGVQYVISGGGGASTYPAEPDEYNEICVQTHHYCILRVSEDTIQLDAITIEGDLLDRFTLERNE